MSDMAMRAQPSWLPALDRRYMHGYNSYASTAQDWSEELFAELHNAGGSVYSNYAVGYNNVDVKAATRHGIAVGNTPGQQILLCSQSARSLWLTRLHQESIFC